RHARRVESAWPARPCHSRTVLRLGTASERARRPGPPRRRSQSADCPGDGEGSKRAALAVQRVDSDGSAHLVERPKHLDAWGRGVRQRAWRPSDGSQRATLGRPIRLRLQRAVRHQSARPPALVCDAFAAGWRRPARDTGASRPRPTVDDAALYPRERHTAARCISQGTSTRPEYYVRLWLPYGAGLRRDYTSVFVAPRGSGTRVVLL